MVNLFPKTRPLPRNIFEVIGRYKDIMYSDKIGRDIEGCKITNNQWC